jgi:hypothetical protein
MGIPVKILTNENYVDPFRIDDTKRVIEKYVREAVLAHDQVVINITGGTKLMSIGALYAAKSLGAKAIYVDTENQELIIFYPDGRYNVEKMHVTGFKIWDHMTAHGGKVISMKHVEDLPAIEIHWAQIIVDHFAQLYPVINLLTKYYFKNIERPGLEVPCPIGKRTRREVEGIKILDEGGLWRWDPDHASITILDKDKGNFLNGLWVEVYTAACLQTSGFFDEVALNIQLDKGLPEIDVAVLKNGRLAFIECKSNVLLSEKKKENILLSTLANYKKNYGGAYGLAFFVRASKENADRIRIRAKDSGIDEAFFGEGLRNLPEMIIKYFETQAS